MTTIHYYYHYHSRYRPAFPEALTCLHTSTASMNINASRTRTSAYTTR